MNNIFEYDSNKNNTNKLKHDLYFESAEQVWEDPFAIVAPTRQIEDEKRFIIIGCIGEKVWSVIFTYRKEKIRIISARRARKEEIYYYEKNKS